MDRDKRHQVKKMRKDLQGELDELKFKNTELFKTIEETSD